MRANANFGGLRRDKEKLSLPISCELGENNQPTVEVIRVKTYNML